MAVPATALVAGMAGASCFVEYKAKQDDPLRLHYGIVELDDDECDRVEDAVAERLEAGGWTLLTVMDTLKEKEAHERKDDAGTYFLRY
ncbi:hypothetical protein [Palleronia caenipelagi]|uniref:Uncharacterized protein n=1 Tax=Palleronia caenipelagi TaxID=2489174 RepID=A0A547Q9X4_9RHOB|nr:hypothetical protein [Palleronia caenipelagi]TRD23193.1 hypothetical protein FEV53_01145 [Palleronia caenipelagi]